MDIPNSLPIFETLWRNVLNNYKYWQKWQHYVVNDLFVLLCCMKYIKCHSIDTYSMLITSLYSGLLRVSYRFRVCLCLIDLPMPKMPSWILPYFSRFNVESPLLQSLGSTFLLRPSITISCCGSLFGQIWLTFGLMYYCCGQLSN